MVSLDPDSILIFLHAACATVFGACFGSFAGLIIYRLPKGLSIITPRSYCASCQKTLKAWHNIPLLSWLILRGRCGFCKAVIGGRIVLLEAMMAIGFLALYLKFGASFALVDRAAFLFLLICLAYVDIDTFFLPLSLLVSLIVVGLVTILVYYWQPSLFLVPTAHKAWFSIMIFNPPWRFSRSDRLDGAVFGLLILLAMNFVATLVLRCSGRLTSCQWAMGFGDAFLLSAIGLFVGASHLLVVLFIASFLGSIVGIASRFQKKSTVDQEIAEGALPYGPFLAIAAIYIYLF